MLASAAMRRACAALLLLSPLVVASSVTPARAASGEASRDVRMLDNVFPPDWELGDPLRRVEVYGT